MFAQLAGEVGFEKTYLFKLSLHNNMIAVLVVLFYIIAKTYKTMVSPLFGIN